MSTDLDSRLRDYGTDIDTAIDAPTASPGRATPTRSRWVRYAVPAAAASLVAVAAGVLVASRSPERSAPAGAVTESTVGVDQESYLQQLYGPGDWNLVEPAQLAPVVLAGGIVPFYTLTDEATTQFDGGTFPGGGYWLLACTEWTAADDGAVECTAVESDDTLPNAIYSDDDGRVAELSTSHDTSVDARQYASILWQELGSSRGRPEPQQIDLDGADAWYADEGAESVLGFAPAAGGVVAIESQGFSRDEVIELARNVVPVPAEQVPNIPLVLARSAASDAYPHWVRDDRLVGAVSDGQVCAFPPSHILGDDADPCVALGSDPMLLTLYGQGAVPGQYAGLVSGDVDVIRLDFEDGTQLTTRPTPQSVGDVRAFATKVSGPPATTITALDIEGNELMTIDVASLNEQRLAPGGSEPAEG